ncbi:MAG: AAA family ATPase [Butyribacter sp.]|uniref:AAA family ATPase n=1 Tax=Butyribacter sp. TaxID=2822465 RepID=UPI00399C716A
MKKIAIGKQSFEDIRKKDCFYIDKTYFIKDWWESADDVTLITRPRRFGKTLNMDMLKCFFSNQYEGRKELFEGLDIWKDEEYRELQGTYPVIFLSFADIKGNTFEMARQQICIKILDLYEENEYLLEGDMLGESEKAFYKSVSMDMSDAIISTSLNKLCVFMYKYYGKKVIIILDEYDTPMQEAYMNGYWDELVALTRSLFNSTFKTNPYLERGIMTGITRVSKESIFSDLNNLVVVTTTSNQYNTAFGFTEEEVFTALEEQEISDEKEKVKEWYDGFTFGNKKDIYNPWSIINYLKFKKYETYWADSSSNGLVNELIRTGSAEIKNTMETLMAGGIVEKNIDEQIVFEQLKTNKDAVWSLLLASGYLRIEEFRTEGRLNKKIYSLKLTNYEVEQMFGTMIERWFGGADVPYNEFINAMLSGDIESMNEYMNRVTRGVISYFDTGKTPSDEESERFYHGLVLGLMVDQVDNYILSSNRESGFGRYDIMLEPIDKNNEKYPGIVIEFKVFNQKKEDTLEETVENALRQIKEKDYDAELIKRGVKEENIYHYGFAFKGKEVLIDGR